MTGEFAVLDRLRRMLPEPPPGQTWIGDDAAVVSPPNGALVLTSDAIVAGVHVDLALVGLEDVGWKAMSACLSDVAAMGCTPSYALVTVCAPPDTDIGRLYRGVAEAVEMYSCPVVGGDLVTGPVLMISVTAAADTGHRSPVMRSGAMAGDRLFLTGRLGAAAAGLRRLRAGEAGDRDPSALAHRRPWARILEGRTARAAGATAMVDVSDGLAADVRHLAVASGVGVALDSVPVAPRATVDEALGGGDDYELVFTASNPNHVAATFAQAGLRQPITFGVCTSEQRYLLAGDELPEAGWEHHFA